MQIIKEKTTDIIRCVELEIRKDDGEIMTGTAHIYQHYNPPHIQSEILLPECEKENEEEYMKIINFVKDYLGV